MNLSERQDGEDSTVLEYLDTAECSCCLSELEELEQRGLEYDEENLDPRYTITVDAFKVRDEGNRGALYNGEYVVHCPKHEVVEEKYTGYIRVDEGVVMPVAVLPPGIRAFSTL